MSDQEFEINISKLEEAKNTTDGEWLEKTFTQPREILEDCGIENLIQQYSDSNHELVTVIHKLEGLNHYIKKYSL